MSVSDAVASRRSSRAFLETQVDQALLRSVLQRALQAPSNSNIQPWLVHLVTGATLTRLKEATRARAQHPPRFDKPGFAVYPDPMIDMHAARRSACGERQYGVRGIARDDQAGRLGYVYNNHQFFGAPVGLFLFGEADIGPSQWADLGIFLQTLMLLLTEAGLDCCAQISWAMMHETVRAALGLRAGLQLYCGLAIGHADPADPINSIVADRAAYDDVITTHV